MKNREKTMKAMERLITVVEELRGENGCPWDRAQTHGSLRMQLIEEAYEAADAMTAYEEYEEADNLREELGDILLQVVFHGVMAEEEGIFTIEDIINEITEKMIHRHPHVFAKEEWERQEEKKTWEQLKAEEKGHSTEYVLPLHGIPKSLPSLLRTPKVLKKSDAVYGKRIQKKESMIAIADLSERLQAAEKEAEREIIMRDMLFHMANIAWQDKINLEEVLMNHTEKLIEEIEPSKDKK